MEGQGRAGGALLEQQKEPCKPKPTNEGVTNPTPARVTLHPVSDLEANLQQYNKDVIWGKKSLCFKGNKTFVYLKMYNLCDKKYGCYLYFLYFL